MKLYRNAIILVVVIAILGGAYYYFNKTKGTADNTGTSSSPTTIKLTDYTSDKVANVTLENDEGTTVIGKKGTDWIVTSPAGFKSDSSKLSSLVINAASVSADKVAADDSGSVDLAEYGLDKPVQVTVKITDGTVKTLEIGGQTPTKDGYYVMLKGDPKIYVVSSYTVEAMLVTRNDIRDKTLYTLKSDDIISFGMERDGESVFTAEKGSDSNWNMLTPIQGNVSADAISPMLDAVSGTTAQDYVDDNPSDLSKYGLDKPSYVLEFGTSTAKYKLLLGDEKTKGSVIYAMLDGTNEVFTMDESAYTFLDKPLKEIVDVFAYIVNIDQVNKIELTMDGQTTTMGLDVYKDANGKSDADKDKFTVNGQDASGKDANDKQPFRTFYQSLIGISLDDLDIGAVPAGNPEISVKYYLKSAPGTMQVDFVPKNADYDYVLRNGKYTGIEVRRDKQEFGIQGMKSDFKTMMDFLSKQK